VAVYKKCKHNLFHSADTTRRKETKIPILSHNGLSY